MIRLPPKSTRTYTLCPDTTLFLSQHFLGFLDLAHADQRAGQAGQRGDILRHGAERRREGRCRLGPVLDTQRGNRRSEEHTSELQSLMRNSYAVLCLKKKNKKANKLK